MCNPYCILALLSTSLDSRVNSCSESSRSLPSGVGKWQTREPACLMIKPLLLLSSCGPQLSPSATHAECTIQHVSWWTLHRFLFKGKSLRAYSLKPPPFPTPISILTEVSLWTQRPWINYMESINPLKVQLALQQQISTAQVQLIYGFFFNTYI